MSENPMSAEEIDRLDSRTRPNVTPRPGPMRNRPCPCGSGKKYKRCCLNKPAPAPVPVRLPARASTRNLAAALLAESLILGAAPSRRGDNDV